MKETLSVSTSELNSLKLSLNAYLALIQIYYGNVNYRIQGDDLMELYAKGWTKSVANPIGPIELTEKANKYFQNVELFKEFFNIFPHTVPSHGDYRPLRTESTDTMAASITKLKWQKKFKGNVERQQKAIEVLKREIQWRESSNSLQFMHNIDAWINDNDFERYEYLLNDVKNVKTFIKDL